MRGSTDKARSEPVFSKVVTEYETLWLPCTELFTARKALGLHLFRTYLLEILYVVITGDTISLECFFEKLTTLEDTRSRSTHLQELTYFDVTEQRDSLSAASKWVQEKYKSSGKEAFRSDENFVQMRVLGYLGYKKLKDGFTLSRAPFEKTS